MRKNRLNWTRVLVVGAVSLLSAYTGVRTAADETTVFSFKGQILEAVYFGEGAAFVICLDGVNGNGQPTPFKKAYLESQTQTADTLTWASTFDYVDYVGSFTGVNAALRGTATCDATATGTELAIDLTTWDGTDHGPIVMHGNAALGNPTVETHGINTRIVRDSATGTMTRFRSNGKFGFNPAGTLSLEVISGGTGTVPAISGDVTSDWSSISVVHNSRFQKVHF